MMIYEPAEDSYLLEKYVQRLAFGRVLDVGTGSGIQALAALKNHDVGEVVAVDINPEAVSHLKDKIRLDHIRKINAVQSDLFENVSGKFNTIIFNPPYLPQDNGLEDPAVYGGRKGWEISERFFKEVSKCLAPEGKIFFLFSTLTNKNKIEEFVRDNLLEFKELDRQKISFETLYVYEISKTDLLRELEAKLLEDIHFFSKGKRGMIYTAVQDRSQLIKTHFPSKKDLVKVAIKVKREDWEAINRIQNETNWLKILNSHGIGPKLLFSNSNYLVYRFVEGRFILDWIKDHSKAEIKGVIAEIFEQCYKLDNLGVNKEELHHPLKHILITSENRSIMIDFERCSKTIRPKNVTQFIEFICRIQTELDNKGFKISINELRGLAEEYKDTLNPRIIKDVLSKI